MTKPISNSLPGRLHTALRLLHLGAVLAHGALAFAWLRINHPRGLRSRLPLRALWLQGVCRRLLRLLGVRVHVTGTPAPGALITPNHVGYMDILVLGAEHPLAFVAKSDVRGWPVIGWLAALAGTRFIDRTRRSDIARASSALAPTITQGVGVVIFLEGTSSDGGGVLPFKSSLLARAAASGWMVQPAALAYTAPDGHSAAREICWWGDMTLPGHLWNLLTLRRIEARLNWGAARPAGTDRKPLAAELHAEVVRLHRDIKNTA